jgi:hypothetical protein
MSEQVVKVDVSDLLAKETFSRDAFAQVMSHFRLGDVLESAADAVCLTSMALRIGS